MSSTTIELLSPDVVNQIAAGEVVERPAHLVKELIENSIDAGATKINVQIDDGGRRILIQDNGSGIRRDDLSNALERFATSKIKTSDDLWKLKSYGFRGEALASISAVSLLTLKSYHSESDRAFEIKSEFGKKSQVSESDLGSSGTVVEINQLFQNIPARLKFLKSDGAEVLQIKNFLRGLALIHPEIEFQIREQDKLFAIWKKQDHDELEAFRRRGLDVLEIKKLHVAAFQHEKFKINVLFSDPSTVQKTSKNIWIFLNQRLIQDRAIQTAIMESYKSLLMHGEYPTVVLDLRVPEDFVDVNVHPAKSQVKFQEASQIFRLVHSVLRSELEKAPWRLNQGSDGRGSSEETRVSQVSAAASAASGSGSSPFSQAHFQRSFTAPEINATNYQKKDYSLDQLSAFRDQRKQLHRELDQAENATSQTRTWKPDQNDQQLNSSDQGTVVSTGLESSKRLGFWSSLDVIGQFSLTYIVAQSHDQLYLVDQHAAHERVRYETLIAAWKGEEIDIQANLFPDAVELNPPQVEALLHIQDQFQKLGITIESLGPSTLGVVSAPTVLKDFRFASLFEKIAQDVLEYGGSYSLEEKISDICATMACHSVVRAGQALSHAEMKALLQQMDGYPLSEYCPHGRPVYVCFGINQIEKLFGRSGA